MTTKSVNPVLTIVREGATAPSCGNKCDGARVVWSGRTTDERQSQENAGDPL